MERVEKAGGLLMVGLLSLLWLVGLIACFVFMIAPNRRWPLVATRLRALGCFVGLFFAFPVLVAILSAGNPSFLAKPPPAVGSNTTSTSVSAVAKSDPKSDTGENKDAAAASPNPSKWTYDEDKDEMRGTSTQYARIDSDETFPNVFGMGRQATQLEVQKRGRGYDVALANPNLQFTCNSFTNTHMSVKFDNGPVTRFGCTDAKGNKYGVAFITPGSRFVEKLRRAKRVTVEAEIYQRGDVQMSFDTQGLRF